MTSFEAAEHDHEPDDGLLGPFQPAIDLITAQFSALDIGDRIAVIEQLRSRLDALEAEVLVAQISDPNDPRRARLLASTPKRSRRDASRATRRALLLKEHPRFAADLASGRMTGQQLDVLVSAAERSEHAAIADRDLVEHIQAVSPDRGYRVLNRWLADRRQTADTAAAYAMARHERHARKGHTPDQLSSITLAGDDLTIEQAWRSISALADRMYADDGGRGGSAAQHARTLSQRLYDAAIDYLTGASSQTGAATTSIVITVDAQQLQLPPMTLHKGSLTVAADNGDEPNPTAGIVAPRTTQSRGSKLRSSPNETLGREPPDTAQGSPSETRLNEPPGWNGLPAANRPPESNGPAESDGPARADRLPASNEPFPPTRADDTRSTLKPHLVGVGAVPPTELERLLCDCALSVLVVDPLGQPLWLGRTQRTASAGQRLSLIVRDRSCVLCGAHHQRCEVHHLIPFNARSRGKTDIDNLALVCGPCHRRLHDQRLTLERHHKQRPHDKDHHSPTQVVWSTRPATPEEIAPRFNKNRNEDAA